ncbi:hypothetical protein FRC02_010976 [Tulasnella sp. 418]|nr:hypothetical protein FRC02_010976 [Tulasnella sp. 418]
MASSVYYKFKSQRQESRVTFDGTGISVFDLKKEIILANNLKATDIDLLLFDNAGQEYKDDSFIIPRATSVIAKRMPAIKPGKGKAAIYVSGIAPSSGTPDSQGPGSRAGSTAPGGRFTGAMSRRFDGRDDKPKQSPAPSMHPEHTTVNAQQPTVIADNDDEAAAIAAMFSATSEQWQETQEKMAHATPVYNANRNFTSRPYNRPQQQYHHEPKPLPPGYICHRCSKKGHWIQDCPTNDDREYDNRPRIKRTTGIPRSFLKSVDMPTGSTVPSTGVMITPEGGFVVAEPDSAAWQKQRARPKGITEAEVRERPPTDPSLACPYPNCGKLFRDAVKTPCCNTTYCEECIQTHLLEANFECPNCHKKVPSLDKLIVDRECRQKVKNYIDHAVEESKKEEEVIQHEPLQQSTPEPQPTDPSPDDEYSELQPGNEDPGQPNNVMLDPQQMITQYQAQLAQLMIMQNNPSLPPQTRMQMGAQIASLTYQLKQAEQMRDAMMMQAGMMPMDMGMGNMGMGMGGPPMMGMNGPMGMGGPGVGMMGAPMMNNPMNPMGGGGGFYGQQQQFQKSFGNRIPVHQPGGDESAYQRLPVNNRRKNLKRERPADFVDVGGDQKRQFWE